jgi:hypothetical protein
MKPQLQWLAARTIIAVEPDGREQMVTLRVGIPFEVSPEEWACACAMDGYHENLGPIHGVDAWQAIQLAFSLQHQLLGYLSEKGTKFLYEESREPLALAELFPKPPRSNEGLPSADA